MNLLKPFKRVGLWRLSWLCLLVIVLLSLALFVPEPEPALPAPAKSQAFAWNRDALWASLERQFQKARTNSPALVSLDAIQTVARIWDRLNTLPSTSAPPSALVWDALETNLFRLAPEYASGKVEHHPLSVLMETAGEIQREAKRQSRTWAMDQPEARNRLYRLLYGSRAALEEVLLQLPPNQAPVVISGNQEPAQTPSVKAGDILLCSGDILVSRGGAATSALIARGNDYPGNFSHVALLYVNETNQTASVIESHIENGVSARPVEAYLQDTKLRIMVLRLRPDLPQMKADPMLPHKAALLALHEAQTRHIPYDFAMDYKDSARQFCSEVVSSAYRSVGVNLWMGMSHISTPGVMSWLGALGVRHFETQEPSDLEYDPQLNVVAEWREPVTLFEDHVDNAVVDAMLERAEAGEKLGYDRWQLPKARLAKAWSMFLNWRGKPGRIPEGMSATTALRVRKFTQTHAVIKELLFQKALAFRQERGYVPPYWELMRMAREARDELYPKQ